jgi:hypothetical protein
MRFFTLRFMLLLVTASMLSACRHSDAQSGDLRAIIEQQIRANVRESFGELTGQCFSDADLDRFTRDKVAQGIVAQLKTNSRFLATVEKVRAMPPDARSAYLKRCRLPLHKTWAELGSISSKGQTDAGQRAELMISNAIVDLAENLLAGPLTPAKK